MITIWQSRWYEYLQQAFAQPSLNLPVECRGLLVHVRLEEGDDQTIQYYESQSLTLVRLGTQAIQRLVSMTITGALATP